MSWIRVTLVLLLLAFTATAEVVPLTDATFAENVNSVDSLWFIEFYADLYPFSGRNLYAWTRLSPTWEQLVADEKVRQAEVKIGAVDCAASMWTCGRLSVRAYHTMKTFFNGEELKGVPNDFGDMDAELMKAFALEMQKQLAPFKSTSILPKVICGSVVGGFVNVLVAVLRERFGYCRAIKLHWGGWETEVGGRDFKFQKTNLWSSN